MPTLNRCRPARMPARRAVSSAGSVLLLALVACGTAHHPNATDAMPEPDSPAGVLAALAAQPYYNADAHPQSPKPPTPQWRGVAIAAEPKLQLTLKAPMAILRGAFSIAATNYPADDRIKVTAVDAAGRREYSNYAGQQDASPDVPPPPGEPPDKETLRRMVFSGHFNLDLMGTLRLPWTNATYRVRAFYGNLPSNELTLQIVVP